MSGFFPEEGGDTKPRLDRPPKAPNRNPSQPIRRSVTREAVNHPQVGVAIMVKRRETEIQLFGIGTAIEKACKGLVVTRYAWLEESRRLSIAPKCVMLLEVVTRRPTFRPQDPPSETRETMLRQVTPPESTVGETDQPYHASPEDLLAEDWMVLLVEDMPKKENF